MTGFIKTAAHGAPTAGIYVSLPFCGSHCDYCSNPAARATPEALDTYLRAIQAELMASAQAWSQHRIASIYLGGGTPTLFGITRLGALLDTIHTHFAVDGSAEITTEANPETISTPMAHGLRALGIHRVSLGAQSFQPHLLKQLGRSHRPATVHRAVDALRIAGINNLSLDLIYAIPGQTLAESRADLLAAIALTPDHLSVYGLISEAGTGLEARVAAGGTALPDDTLYADLYDAAVDQLAEAGYARYEIANFARVGFQCRHNLTYWQGGDWLGVGAGAGTHRNGYRQNHAESVEDYLAGAAPEWERLEPAARFHEAAIFGLRTTAGIDLGEITTRLGIAVPKPLRQSLLGLTKRGLLRWQGAHITPTRQGFLHHDEIGLGLAQDVASQPDRAESARPSLLLGAQSRIS